MRVENKKSKVNSSKKGVQSSKEQKYKEIVKSKDNKKVKKNSKKSPKGIFTIFLGIFFVGLISFLIYYICTSSYFNIIQINVEGASKYTNNEIVEKSGIKYSKNIILTSSSKAVKSIKELPYVDNVIIIKKFPNTVIIKVIERVSEYFAYDKDKNTYYRISSDGIILEQANLDTKTSSELLTYGITFDNEIKFGVSINETDISKIVIYKNILSAYEKTGINMPITKLNFENSLTTLILNDKLSIVLPNDTNLEYNMTFLKNIISKLDGDATGVIDMTKNNPVFSQI
ncbi:MAG: FtsQ-type POTRA domain-containing protein [Clostridia bacterium]|nr:FtsQ-type POTRA domain-containing protein [Clostridia bacterium]